MTKAELLRISVMWGNRQWAAPYDFLRELDWYLGHTDGHIIECGSGATSLVIDKHLRAPSHLRDLSKYREAHVLEHDAGWHGAVMDKISPQSMVVPHLLKLVPQDDGSQWYDMKNVYIPANIGLVVVDGPPGGLNRAGFTSLAHKFNKRTIVLFDDADRDGAMIENASKKLHACVERVPGGRGIAIMHSIMINEQGGAANG